MRIPDDVLAELAFLNAESSKVRGHTPIDDPRRQAGDDFCKLALAATEQYDVTLWDLSRLLGLSTSTVRLKLGRRGYLTNYNSQSAYKGVLQKRGLKTICKRGHDMSTEGARRSDGRCKECATARDRAKYAAKRAKLRAAGAAE